MLIGLTGCKGVGKDLAGSFLVEQGYTRLAFADKLKEAVANLFGCSIDEVEKFKGETDTEIPYCEVILQHGTTQWSYTWREFLQHFGTEMGRNTFGQDFWTDQWKDTLTALYVMEPDAARSIVVTDVRFDNEATAVKIAGGYIVEITRPGHEPDGHPSEDRINPDLIDATIDNNGTPGQLKTRFLATVHGLEVGVVSG